jgi:hypothetical protein
MSGPSLPAVLRPAARSRFPHRARALLGFFAAPGVTHSEFTQGLAEWSRRRAAALPSGASLRVGVRIAGTEGDLQESVGSYFGEEIAPLDGFATISLSVEEPTSEDLDALVAGLTGIGDELAGVVDRDRSFAVAGLVNLVIPDDGPVAMVLMCRHHPDVELVATHEWWCSFGEVIHAANQGHTLGYHQVQCDPQLSARAAEVAGLAVTDFDLGDLVYLGDVEGFVGRARPQHRPEGQPAFDPGPPVNQRDDFITFQGSVGAFCEMF